MPTQEDLPHCVRCGTQMRRGGSTYARLAANPHVFDGWVCRSCRGGHRITHNVATERAAAGQPQSNTATRTNSSDLMILDKTKAVKSIDMAKYENLFVGFELESDGSCSAMKNALRFTGRIGKTNGIDSDEQTIGEVTIRKSVNRYKNPELVTQIYEDASVGAEVVTRPVSIKRLDLIEPIHAKIAQHGNMWAQGRGGCHMTFLLDTHKELSEWDAAVVRNIMQFARCFYPEIVKAFGGGGSQTRPLNYRALPQKHEVDSLVTTHYTAISTRTEGGRVWAIEVRFPDGTMNFSLLQKQVFFWAAVIRQCANISRFGLLNFKQEKWEENKDWVISHSGRNSTATNEIDERIKKFLKDSLTYYRYESIAVQPTEEQYNAEMSQIETLFKEVQ